MEEYRTKLEDGRLLHIIQRIDESVCGRQSLIDPIHPLQLAVGAGFPAGHKFTGPHYHLPVQRNSDRTMEAWIILKGSVKVSMYDIDKSHIADSVLNPGDCYVYFEGGHGFEILNPDTRIVEIKNGPYFGQQKDKEFI